MPTTAEQDVGREAERAARLREAGRQVEDQTFTRIYADALRECRPAGWLQRKRERSLGMWARIVARRLVAGVLAAAEEAEVVATWEDLYVAVIRAWDAREGRARYADQRRGNLTYRGGWLWVVRAAVRDVWKANAQNFQPAAGRRIA